MAVSRYRVWGGASVLALGLLATTGWAATEADKELWSSFPPRTDAGEWTGTWFYNSVEKNLAFWFRETDGQPQLQIQVLLKDSREGFRTDWDTRAEYMFRERRGTFAINFTQRDANTLAGEWSWQWGSEWQPIRLEKGRVTMYRAAAGRQMVLLFEDLERSQVLPDGTERRVPLPQGWTLHKASQRHARWAELPF